MHTAAGICGDLNENGHNRPTGSDFIGGVALLELVQPFWRKCVTWGVAFEVLRAQARPHGLLFLPADLVGELPATSHVYLLATVFPTMMTMN